MTRTGIELRSPRPLANTLPTRPMSQSSNSSHAITFTFRLIPLGNYVSVVHWPGQTCHFKDGGSAYSIGVGELGWQYGTGLKSHSTVTNWCTRREWLVNYMTVISTQGQSNMPFQRRRKCIFQWPVIGRYWVGVELLYNSVHRKFKESGDQRDGERML